MLVSQKILSIHEAEAADFESIVNYFLDADNDFLLGMGVDLSKLPDKEKWLKHKNHRQKGIGCEFVRMSLPFYFDKFKLKRLYCEPSAGNPAPNNTLKKLEFKLLKKYDTTPGWINLYQTVNCWCMDAAGFQNIITR